MPDTDEVEKLVERLRNPEGDEKLDFECRLDAADALLAIKADRDALETLAENNALLWRAENARATALSSNWRNSVSRLRNAESERDALSERLAEAERVIEPFAELAKGEPDDCILWTGSDEFRRARAFLNKEKNDADTF